MPVNTERAKRHTLIKNAFFPEEETFYKEEYPGESECGCPFCFDGDPEFADPIIAPAEAVSQAVLDGTLQALESLINISSSGVEENALAASEILLEFFAELAALAE